MDFNNENALGQAGDFGGWTLRDKMNLDGPVKSRGFKK
jgi:hypothetical protein